MSADNRTIKQYCILFYKYHPLTDNPDVLETYRHATEALCASLNLTGRILIGLSNDGEGVNGTLAGTKDDLNAYVDCMLGKDVTTMSDLDQRRKDAVLTFREASKQFFAHLNQPELFLNSPNDFKWSSSSDSSTKEGENWFPDLNIKIVKEIISSGGAFSDITTKDTSVGYLTPQEWHKEIQSLVTKHKKQQDGQSIDGKGTADEDVETILIDVRNTKECKIGSFAPGLSIDPQTKTFAQFPKWVKENSAEADTVTSTESSTSSASSLLNNKRILMYCTGGIRCEKASAYIRQVVPQNKGIFHLKGGIHKYLEEFGHDALEKESKQDPDGNIDGAGSKNNIASEECLFVGKNFVFDRRGALDAKGHGVHDTSKDASSSQVKPSNKSTVIGKCQYCSDPYDTFLPENVCTVCREPILVCGKCEIGLHEQQQTLRSIGTGKVKSGCRTEYHCEDHIHLKTCYFTSLHGFSVNEMEKQVAELQRHSKQLEGMGKKGKQRRRTLRKQIDKIEVCMKQKLSNETCELTDDEPSAQCRHCGSSSCTSDCWGFHGGNTRMVNKKKSIEGGTVGGTHDGNGVHLDKLKQRSRIPSNQRPAKRAKRDNDIAEIHALQLSNPPSQHRNDATGLRIPPPVVRVLRSGVKGRWCGKTVMWVLNNDFGESLQSLTQEGGNERLEQLITAGLVRVNGVPIESSDVVLRNMDTIERIVHWHEPPCAVPSKISLTKHTLPESTITSNSEATGSPLLYCIDKPATVPIYAAGSFYSNSLLMMVEAQEGLPPKSLIPLHRIDRATSGVMLCTNMSSVARVVQGQMTSNSNNDKIPPIRKLYLARVKGKFPSKTSETPAIPDECAGITSITWCGDDGDIIEVDAPIAVQLEASNKDGKDASPSNTMMHRAVQSDGKHSTSRFKLISYDATTDHSLVSCAPITGRGHQLRVHLQLIGFPIQNDAEYGGAVDAESMKMQERLSAQSMVDINAKTSDVLHEESVTAQEVASAVQLCRCCSGGTDGISASFNSAQLLGCGHAIDLHAYKYCISLKQKDISGDGTAMMTFSTDLPLWASSFAGIEKSSFTWLK